MSIHTDDPSAESHFRQNPYPTYDRLRRQPQPIALESSLADSSDLDPTPTWAVFRYADCAAALSTATVKQEMPDTGDMSQWTQAILREVEAERADGFDFLARVAHPLAAQMSAAAGLSPAFMEIAPVWLALALVTLMRYPKQRALLRVNPVLWGKAVEELLRLESPVQAITVTLRTDVTLDTRTLSAGEQVLVNIGSAHRDPRFFPNADVFDIARRATFPLLVAPEMAQTISALRTLTAGCLRIILAQWVSVRVKSASSAYNLPMESATVRGLPHLILQAH